MDKAGSREPFCRGEETITKNGRHQAGASLADVERIAPAPAAALAFGTRRLSERACPVDIAGQRPACFCKRLGKIRRAGLFRVLHK